MSKHYPNRIDGNLRKSALRIPQAVYQCSGILVFGRRIKSFAFTTDLAIVRNINADAILAVYPFTPQPIINQALLMAADIPVFVGVGGGLTQGSRVVQLAAFAEMQGAAGVVVNAPTDPETIQRIAELIDIPIVVTAVNWNDRVMEQIEAGASIINVAGAAQTPQIIRTMREHYPKIPIIASGGKTDESILSTIQASANAISWTPPSSKEICGNIMDDYRRGKEYRDHLDASEDEEDEADE